MFAPRQLSHCFTLASILKACALPFFLSYYGRMGVDRVIFLDHQSDDETAHIIDDHVTSVRIPVAGNFVYRRMATCHDFSIAAVLNAAMAQGYTLITSS